MENGLTEEKISALDSQSAGEKMFSNREAVALRYAEMLAVNHHNIGDALFIDLKEEFSDPEILELGMMIGQYIGFGRLLKVLDLEDRFCKLPS